MVVCIRTMASRPVLETERDAEFLENLLNSRCGGAKPFSSWGMTPSCPKCQTRECHDGDGLQISTSVSPFCWNTFSPGYRVYTCRASFMLLYAQNVFQKSENLNKVVVIASFWIFLTWRSGCCPEVWFPCMQACLMLMLMLMQSLQW